MCHPKGGRVCKGPVVEWMDLRTWKGSVAAALWIGNARSMKCGLRHLQSL